MQYRKCVALLTALLVGIGVGTANAATVSSVAVTTPADSGAILGIDSVFVVQAKVVDFTTNDSLEIYLYLTKSGTDSLVIADTTGKATTFGQNAADPAAVLLAATNRGAILQEDASTTAGGATNDFIVAHVTRATGIATKSFRGDGDSVITTASGDTTIVTWYGKVHASSNTVQGIRAAAIAIDGNGTTVAALSDTTAAKLSPANKTFGIDGDRPLNPDQFLVPTGGLLGDAGDTQTYTGFNRGSSKVAGVGDTLRVNVKLGTQTDSVLIGTRTVAAVLFGKTYPIAKTGARNADTLKFSTVIAAGNFGDLVGKDSTAGPTDTLKVYIVDSAGNRSSVAVNDVSPAGVTLAATFFVDGKAPVLDGQVVAGDTVLPVSNDTITDGSTNDIYQDLNRLKLVLAESLDSLVITFDGATTDATIKARNSGATIAYAGLVKTTPHYLDFTEVGSKTDTAGGVALNRAFFADSVGAIQGDTIKVNDTLATGLYTVTLKGYDLAHNAGPVLTRTNVYVDVDDISLIRLFPTAATSLDTVEKVTADVVFQLSEIADSVRITYKSLAGTDPVNTTHTRILLGSELENTTSEVTYELSDSLKSGTQYTLQVMAADLAGNYNISGPDTFIYDTTFVVPVIAKFSIAANDCSAVAAGDPVSLTITALTVSDAKAVTYKGAATLKITGASGLSVWGTGITQDATTPGRVTLGGDDWVTGARVVNFKDTTGTDSIKVAVQDCTDASNLYLGALNGTIVNVPNAYSQLALAAADTVGQGDAFWVGVTVADKFGNTRTGDNIFAEVSTAALGVELPTSAIAIKKGAGGFWANSAGYSGALAITVRDIGGTINATDTIWVDGNGATVLDDPDTLVAEDYMGANGAGDQGGFVLLTWPASDDHASLSGYRIYREITVTTASDGAGGLVALAEPTQANVAWASVDAVPGQTVVRAIVATLDAVASNYSVAAERGGLSSSKVAFDAAATVAAPYELMAEAMQNSRAAAQLDLNAPVFAALSPEALAFDETGVAPRFKVVDGVMLSNLRSTVEAVRAIDNIAPQAVSFLQAIDTPNDFGGAVTVQWAKSADDQMLTVVNSPAVGPNTMFQTAGVAGYNIYRKINDGAFQLVGKAGAGETSYTDQTVFNGVRYTYSVASYDTDNESVTALENSAMAIRNNAVAADGTPVLGLFGADNRVDYDDFFIFADHFGLAAGAEAFEPAFDLSPNNQIDFDDFFVFADYFGKTIQAAGKVVPTMAGLNSDASFFLDAGLELPRVGEDMTIAVSLEEFVEVKAYGLTVSYDADVLEFVGTRVEDNILGETELATPQTIARGEGEIYVAAFGDVASEGNLGLDLVFRARTEIEDSYIELTTGAIQDGSYGINQITTPTSVRIETRPEVYALANNFPNPFNPETTIKYQLPEAGEVTLEIYNMLGQVVNTLVSEYQTAGRYVYQWDATNSNGQSLSSGVYFYRINAGGEFQSIKKMLLLK